MANTLSNSCGASSALAFESTTFDVVTRNNQPWLRSPQIAEALGYGQENRISDLYNRNAAEFTDSMTALVKLATAGGDQLVRCFSLRGAHLLGMFARTDKAADFRRWVLDILDNHVAQLNHSATDALIPSEAQTLRELVDKRCANVPEAIQGKVRAEIWSRVQHKFRVNKYSLLPRTQFADAIAYIMDMEIKAIGYDHPEPAKELASPQQVLAIRRAVDMAARGMHYHSAWTQGIHAYLRKVMDNPAPNPWIVEQLPGVAREMTRVMSAAEQVSDLITKIEREAVRRIFRKGEEAEIVIAEIDKSASASIASMNTERLMLPTWLQRDVAAITAH